MRAEPAIRVERVSYSYGSRGPKALDDVSFNARSGTFTALLGPNGAGKTTLMALITRLFQSRTGRIEVCGHNLMTDPRCALASMGIVFQRPTLDLDLTVEQNLTYAASLYGLDRAMSKSRIAENLERLDMADRRFEPVRQLSGGMRRRIELARALIHQPKMLILDEPTVGLDIPSRQAITRYVHELCAERSLAALWTTHLIDEVWPQDHVIVMARGRIQADGSLVDMMEKAGADDLSHAYATLCHASEVTAGS